MAHRPVTAGGQRGVLAREEEVWAGAGQGV